jgi:membrane associated rhomboid family serine protease
MIGPYPDALSEWGGKNAVLIIEDGEWFRLISPIMLHAGIIHLVGNIDLQLETRVFFEREWGSIRWLIILPGICCRIDDIVHHFYIGGLHVDTSTS